MTTGSQRRSTDRVKLPLWLLVGIIILVVGIVGGSGWWLYQTVRDGVAGWSITDPIFEVANGGNSDTTTSGGDNGGNEELPAPSQSDITNPLISPDSLKPWAGTERVSILLLGIDQRCDEEGPTRTDSMMVITIDPVGLSAGALSLPRDLWVEIPGYDETDRINKAHYTGEIFEHPGGGPALAAETVEATLGVEIDYYVTINFDGFIQAIDHIDGIRIDVPEEIDDPNYPDSCYGYDPFFIEAGEQNMNGQIALKYARTRNTEGGDVDRALRQQLVLLGVRDKVMQFDMVPKLILESPQLWQTFQDSLSTNMTPDEMLQLALLVQDIPRDSINTAVINYQYVTPHTTPNGEQVLIPIRESIRGLRDQLFAPPVIPTPQIDNLPALVAQEEARVMIINGTQTFGLAAATQTFLERNNVNVVEVGNADSSTYPATLVVDYNNKTYTSLYVAQLMGLPPLNVSTGNEPDGDYDILIVLGADWEVPKSGSEAESE